MKERIKQLDIKENIVNEARLAVLRGIRGVPLFIFNNKFSLYGAHPPENIIIVLNKALESNFQEQ